MTTKVLVGLSFILVASLISVRAQDTPAQAAARAALIQKLAELEQPQTRRPAQPAAPARSVAAKPARSTTNAAAAVPPQAMTPPAAPTSTRTPPAAAPATKAPAPPPAKVSSTNEITTVGGITYKNVLVEKVDPDGIFISHSLANGGTAMIKIYANDLPDAWRQKYGFGQGK